MNIVVEVKADELIGAINKLVEAIGAMNIPTTVLAGITTEDTPTTLSVDEFVKGPAQAAPSTTATYTLEDVRAQLTKLSRAGKREAVNTLISSYGVSRLTDVAPEHYADLMHKAGEL